MVTVGQLCKMFLLSTQDVIKMNRYVSDILLT